MSISFEAHKLFDGSEAATSEQKTALSEAFVSLEKLDPMGEPGDSFWISDVTRIARLTYWASLKLEYYLSREQLIESRTTLQANLDLVETRPVILDLENGIILLECSQFRDRGSLSKADAIAKMEYLFRYVCEKANINDLSIIPLRITRTVEDIREIYLNSTNIVSKIVVRNLHNRKIPSNVKIYNPREDADQYIRELLEEDTRVLSQVELEAAREQNLSKSHFAKAVTVSGDPSEITYRKIGTGQEVGEEYTVKTTRDEPIVVTVKVETPTMKDMHNALMEIHTRIVESGLFGNASVNVVARQQGDLFRDAP